MNRTGFFGLRFKVMFPVVMTSVIFAFTSSYLFGNAMKEALLDEFASKGESLAKSLAFSAQSDRLIPDAGRIQGFINEYLEIHGVGYVFITNENSEVLAHSFGPQVPRELLDPSDGIEGEKTSLSRREVSWNGRRILDISAPILAGTQGTAHVGMDLDVASAAVSKVRGRVLVMTMIVGALGIALIAFILNRMIGQVIDLSRISMKIAKKGDLKQPIEISSNDEIGQLAEHFSQMVNELRFERENLEFQVQERTLELRRKASFVSLLQRATVAANEASTVRQAVEGCLHLIGQATGWSAGTAYLRVDSAKPSLKLMGSWYFRDPARFAAIKAATESHRFDGMEGLPGTAFRSHRVEWVSDVTKVARFDRAQGGENLGVRGGIAIPVLVGEEVQAVLEFFSDASLSPDPQLIEVLANLANQLSRVIERSRAQNLLESQRGSMTAASKMSALGEMAGGIAHEINNPLAIIKLITSQLQELLEEEVIDQKLAQSMAAKVEKTADRISTIVTGLKSFSRDGSKDAYQVVDAKRLIEETAGFCNERFKGHGIELRMGAVSPGIAFEGRATQISQVILNLLNNAHDAIEKLDEKWVSLSVVAVGENVEITVMDSGNGIPDEVREKIFQPFFTTKEVGQGTGLGLSVSQGIVSAHHGKLDLDTQSAHTRFVLKLPFKQPVLRKQAEKAA